MSTTVTTDATVDTQAEAPTVSIMAPAVTTDRSFDSFPVSCGPRTFYGRRLGRQSPITFVYMMTRDGDGYRISYGAAVTHPNDAFVKKMGRTIAGGRMNTHPTSFLISFDEIMTGILRADAAMAARPADQRKSYSTRKMAYVVIEERMMQHFAAGQRALRYPPVYVGQPAVSAPVTFGERLNRVGAIFAAAFNRALKVLAS